MSFVDTVGPFVLCVLVGASALVTAIAVWVGYTAKHLSRSRELLHFNHAAKQLVDDLIYEIQTTQLDLSKRVTDQIWALKDDTLTPKGIYR